ncbi:IS200/IS605 family accessory protein TnpB-related protein [Streptomyces sp. ISL-43]|uniref:IS200/IS605 family accessory protein TnpB-related protein n=1 Tax=Streptomyces sp. ISL-43 TaxID=2819183 RepID=UPI001BE85756|nr:IS200/IS605 family accessory protein TnpB-related protein [Streptomyces sp. ISL-43]MBT2452071.1 IS200/IS605 family accessory protein TnpB-related protein [Streptomyces sp. ISL-43]
MADSKKKLRAIDDPFVALGPSGVAIRDRIRVSAADEKVLRLVGDHMGSLAALDLKTRCSQGFAHSTDTWAERKRELTPQSSSRYAGAATKATHDQWALARRCQLAFIQNLEAGIEAISHRLSLPIREKSSKRSLGGYQSKSEWFQKTRRLHVLEERLDAVRADREAGRVRVVRGGKRLLKARHNLAAAGLSEAEWRRRWEAERRFLQADGESGKRFGNETIRIAPDGEISIKLPAPLAHLANAGHGRYVLSGKVAFKHRGGQWRDRIDANMAVAYRIHEDAVRGRWYVTASWQIPPVRTLPLETALAHGVIGVDTNNDHLAAWLLDVHGNPKGEPRRFCFDTSGSADHRDAQIRHALTRLLNWARQAGVKAIAIEDLDFTPEKTREKHGRRKTFRNLISRFPTAKLRARLISMATEHGLAIVAVDPAYTSVWGAQHWRKPMRTSRRKTTRHDAASIAIGRRALGHPIRRRTAPPRDDQSDRHGHRTVQAARGTRGREETRPSATDRPPGEPSPNGKRKRETSAPTTVRGAPVQLMFTA